MLNAAIPRIFKKNFLPLLLLCFCLPLLTSCDSRKTIVHGLDEKEANEIIVFLASKGIEAGKVQNTEGTGSGPQKQVLWDIAVDNDVSKEAMSELNQSGLPRRRGQNLLNIFSNVGLVPTDMQEKIRYQAGLAEQIASTIRKIDGVLDAEVQISFPEDDPLNPGKKKEDITASVYVKHSGVLDNPNAHLATKIRRLVTGSVTGLKYDNVTLILDRARYSDYPVGGFANTEEAKQYVNIWGMVIAKESVTRFRIVFFSMVVVLLLGILAFIWLGWKLFPLLESHGGLKKLFTLKPISGEEGEAGEDSSEKKEKNAEKQPEKKEKTAASSEPDENISDAAVDAEFEGELDEEEEEE
ncbi:MAG: type III secretion inner membrane ring lipoprotein SctJ [Chlamydiales bacterium]|nr:type III secretion inner membrane ring lipoprotein SctJ [Chlamydiia bacterium]MCP5507921.1 type III secretion inner membrane ring lipoprotein SctJ [Chlamydiales bacterium]